MSDGGHHHQHVSTMIINLCPPVGLTSITPEQSIKVLIKNPFATWKADIDVSKGSFWQEFIYQIFSVKLKVIVLMSVPKL